MRAILFVVSVGMALWATEASAAPKKKAAATKKATPPAVALPAGAPEAAAPPAEGSTSMRGPTRIDFDDRLIQGQTNKSGAVYLYDRKELKVRSMIRKRENFRDEIVGSVYDT